jgi:16S rRNA (uracil1498-N3)-methyltransferase
VTKLTELMADQLRPFMSQYSVVRSPGQEKVERWQRLAGQALKQCGAPRLPEIHVPVDLPDLLGAPGPEAAKLMLYEKERRTSLATALADQAQAPEVWLLVGPEGGFSTEEADLARRRGWTACGLPGSTLRAETASLAAATLARFGTGAQFPEDGPDSEE